MNRCFIDFLMHKPRLYSRKFLFSNIWIIFIFFFTALVFSACFTIPQNNHYKMAVTDYVYKGDLYGVKSSIRSGASIEERDPFMRTYTPLMVACREGNYEIAKWLLENGANVNAKARDGHTALMMAAYNRYPNIVKLLLKHGADVHAQSEQGHTALSEVRLEEYKQIEKDLEEAGAIK